MSVYEEYETPKGEKITRIKSGFFYLLGFGALALGTYLAGEGERVAIPLLFLVAPFLFLYPLVRFLFGGKGGLLPALVTVILEEYLKISIHRAANKKNKRRW